MALKLGSLRVRWRKVRANAWNPNTMDAPYYAKLKTNLAQSLAAGRDIPPIVVRRHPGGKHYEIIDGYHRHRALGELGEEKINVFSVEADDVTARTWTNTLNYLRGRPDRKKYGQGVVQMVEAGGSLEALAQVLPEDRDELEALLHESDVSLEALTQLHQDGEADGEGLEKLADDGHDDDFVDLKFRVSVEAAKVIEAEITRLGETLKGKNIRGRALEYMAAQSGTA